MELDNWCAVWIVDNEHTYPGCILELLPNGYARVLKYAIGVYPFSFVTRVDNLHRRYENISYDIYTNRKSLLNGLNNK